MRLAGLYAQQRRIREARGVLARLGSLSPGDQHWKRFIEGRLFLLEDQPEPALLSFARILEDAGKISEALLVAATFGMTEARTITEGLDAADAVLEGFIARYPQSRYLAEVFRRLDGIYAREDTPSEGALKAWTQKAPPRRAALARVSLAKLQIRARKLEKARGTLDEFVKAYPNHPLLSRVQGMRAGLFLRDRNFAGAIAALEAAQRQATNEDARAEIELEAGLVHYRAGEYLLAANLFDSVAEKLAKRERLDPGTRRESRAIEIVRLALYNGALAALNQQNSARFEERSRDLSRLFPESGLRSDLILEQGLIQARGGKPQAVRSLEDFIRKFPGHPRLPEAPASWRNQALFKKAQALELAADREGALRAYYDVLQLTLQGDEREYFWFTKAGFEAARMLESQAHWKAAVGVYEKIAAAQGPRAQEALARVKQLRLEHFLWD